MASSSVLHLTHTDITIDGRILKEMEALRDNFLVFGVGVSKLERNTEGMKTFRSKPVFGSKILGYLWCYLTLIRFVLSMKPHIVHVHDWYMLPIGCLVKLFRNSRLVYDAHELEVDVNSTSKFRKYAAIVVEYVFVRFIDRFITVSDTINEFYIQRYKKIKNDNSVVILNAPSLDIPKNLDGREVCINRDKLNIIYVGGIENGRGIEQFIEYCSALESHIDFYLLGYGSLESSLKKQVETAKLSNVNFLGRVSHSEVTAYVEKMDYGLCIIEPVSKSDEYCLPNKLFEYYCSGKRIIGSNLIEIKQFIENNKCGLILDESWSANQLLTQLEEDMKTPSESTVNMKYSWEHQAKLLVELYEGI